MQRKIAFLIYAMATLISLSQAYAETLEDAGKFEIRSARGDFRLGIGGLLQPTMQFENIRDPSSEWRLNFNLNKARLRLYGNAFDPALTYLFQTQYENDFTTSRERMNKGSSALLDYSVSWAMNPDWFHIAVGKFAVPGSRQQVIWAAKTQFLPGGKVLNAFNAVDPYNRDVGVLFHNAYNHPIEYAVAVVSNGLAGRLGYNYGAIDGYDAVDFPGGDLRFGVGASGFFRSDYLTNFNVALGSVDYIVKYRHFASNGAFYYKRDKGVNKFGAGFDAGYLINDTWEPVLRYAWAKPDAENKHEIMAGLNHYWFGHNLKGEIYVGGEIGGKKLSTTLLGLGLQFAL